MFILNRTNKSLFLALSLLINSLQAAQPAALPGAGTPAPRANRESRAQLPARKAESLPLPNLPGRLLYSGLFGGFAGMTTWHVLTTKSGFGAVRAAIAAQGLLHQINPLDACLGGSVAIGAGVGLATFMRLRSISNAAKRNEKEHNALAAQVEQFEPRIAEIERRAEAQETGLRALHQDQANLQTGQDSLERQINQRAQEATQALAALATLQEQRFQAADQARAANTQRLFDQAGAHHAATETRFTTLDEAQRQQLEEQRATREQISQLTENLARLLALADRQTQRTLTQDGEEAAAREVPQRMALPWAVAGGYIFVQRSPLSNSANSDRQNQPD